MDYKPGDTVYAEFCTQVFATGVATNADSLPTGTVNRNGTDDGAVTVTVTNLDAGRYKASFAVPATYVPGDVLNLTVAATVSTIAGKSPVWSGRVGTGVIYAGTASAGASGSITLAGAVATNDYYKQTWIVIVGGTGAGQVRFCTAYVGSTKVASVSPNWATTPDNTSVFAVLPAAGVEVEQINSVSTSSVTTVAAVQGTSVALHLTAGGAVQLDAAQPNAVVFAAGVTINQSTLNGNALTLTGNGSGDGLHAVGGASGVGIMAIGNNVSYGDIACGGLGVMFGDLSGRILGNPINSLVGVGVQSDLQTIKTRAVTCSGGVTIPAATLASTTNITAGTITTATNLTNAPTAGDFTPTMKTSLNAATPASVGTVTDSSSVIVTALTGLAGAGMTGGLPILSTQLDGSLTVGSNLRTIKGQTVNDPGGAVTIPTSIASQTTASEIATDTDTIITNQGTQGTGALATSAQAGTIISQTVASAIAVAVLDVQQSLHNNTGTIGYDIGAAGSAADPLLNPVPGSYPAGSAGYVLGNLPATANVTISPVVITLQDNQITAPPIAIFYESAAAVSFILQDATGTPIVPPGNAVWELVVFTPNPITGIPDTTLFTTAGTISGSTVSFSIAYTSPTQIGAFGYGLWDSFNHKCYGSNRCQIVNAGVP